MFNWFYSMLRSIYNLQQDMLKFVSHSYTVQKLAKEYGWLPGARYTNLRDVKKLDRLGFLDIDWKSYNFDAHLRAVKSTQPLMTVAQDVLVIEDLENILEQAWQLREHASHVIVVPKDPRMESRLSELIPDEFILGYSVPTRYGGTTIRPSAFRGPVHLLGGRPDVQRRLANELPVCSIDGNRFTVDAAYGDYFNGSRFVPHPEGGYERCLRASFESINELWADYDRHPAIGTCASCP